MRRPGGDKVYETFADAAFGDVKIRPPRKRAKAPGHRLSVRIDDKERAYLQKQAGSLTLSNYVRGVLLGDHISQTQTRPKRRKRAPKADAKAIARALALLGQSRLSSNLNQIAKLANMGALPVTDELTEELQAACADIAGMRSALMNALRMRPK